MDVREGSHRLSDKEEDGQRWGSMWGRGESFIYYFFENGRQVNFLLIQPKKNTGARCPSPTYK